MQHQWAALSGLSQNFQEVLGFIKFSIGVFATGDNQVKCPFKISLNNFLYLSTFSHIYLDPIV